MGEESCRAFREMGLEPMATSRWARSIGCTSARREALEVGEPLDQVSRSGRRDAHMISETGHC